MEARKAVRGRQVLLVLRDRLGHRDLPDLPDRRVHAGPPVHRDLPACLAAAADHPVVPWAAAVPAGRPDVEEW